MTAATATTAAVPHRPIYKHLYFQVLTAIVLGVLLGHFYPQLGEQMKPLGDGFIKLIKMLIAPIIFCTVVHGIASMEDLKKVGRVGLKALIYFEVVTTLALIVGLVVVNALQPGAGMNVDPKTIDTRPIQVYTTKAGQESTVDFLSGLPSVLPVGIAEVGIPGLTLPPAGPTVPDTCRTDLMTVDGSPLGLRVVGSTAAATAGRGLQVQPCGPGSAALPLGAGNHVLRTSHGTATGIDLDQVGLGSERGGAALATGPSRQVVPATVTAARGAQRRERDAFTQELDNWILRLDPSR